MVFARFFAFALDFGFAFFFGFVLGFGLAAAFGSDWIAGTGIGRAGGGTGRAMVEGIGGEAGLAISGGAGLAGGVCGLAAAKWRAKNASARPQPMPALRGS